MANGVALIVVHGVAEQKPGDTVRALADLLVATEGGHAGSPAVAYAALGATDLILNVEPLEPRRRVTPRTDASPRLKDKALGKAWLQSRRSDFRAAPARGAGAEPTLDRGIGLTDYLLAKHRDNGAGPEVFETRCLHLERREGKPAAVGPVEPLCVDVYEMYWADLSRLSGAVPRMVSEIFTMVFRLSKLGRDTVDEAHRAIPALRHPRAWALTTRVQVALDWLFANVLALLFAQLFLLAQVFVGLGIGTAVGSLSGFHIGAACTVLVVGGLVFLYERRGSLAAPARWAPPFIAAAAAGGAIFFVPLRPWVSCALLFTLVSFVYDGVLRIGAERFPLVRVVGRAMWGALLALMLASAVHEALSSPAPRDPQGFDVAFHAALFGVELTLLAIKWWWVATGFLLLVWLATSVVASAQGGYEARASLATGRLGLVLSLASFLALTMAIWALLTTVLDVSVRNVRYSPCLFTLDESAAALELEDRGHPVTEVELPASAPSPASNACLWSTAAARRANAGDAASLVSARLFLADRYINSTTGFSVLAFVMLLLVAYLTAAFVPSVLAELKLLAVRAATKAHDRLLRHRIRAGAQVSGEEAIARRERVRRLGRWLTFGWRRLDIAVLVVSVAAVALAFAFTLVYLDGLFGWELSQLRHGDDVLKGWSQRLLEPLVLTTAGLLTLLSVLGGLLSKYLPELRAPLDVALDVDNHFREFPRTGIPRARIFSRYAALLAHVQAQGPERIVVVAHSQGTVITADLLRFLCSPAGDPPVEGQTPTLARGALAPVHLLTLGCPLRQLYAARFPTLYRWVIQRRGRVVGPRALDIGVARWINAFCSGDYVGRWLWSDSPDDDDPVGHPLTDTVDPTPFGRSEAYDAFDPTPPAAQPFASAVEIEVCLGFGAHTHYLESDQVQVAWLVDRLVADR